MPKRSIEINEQFRRALDLIEKTGKNVFITGRAGTGKSTLLSYFRAHTRKKIVVLAPTGVAALNVAGQTIHSFFRFKPDITLGKVKKMKENRNGKGIYKKLETIVIDEISMVRADLLDCADKFMRLNGRNKNRPFGGAQMVFVGDLYQLPPVVPSQEKKIFNSRYKTPYFFSADIFPTRQKLIPETKQFEMEMIELEKIYRQEDQHFISLLNAIRNNTAGEEEISALNKRYKPDFDPPTDKMWVTLTTTNQMARLFNEEKLKKIKGREYLFHGEIIGNFDSKNLPTELELKVKIGAQIMLLNNDSRRRWVNGTLGEIKNIYKDDNGWVLEAKLADGKIVDIESHRWDMFRFEYDERKNQIVSEVAGSFIQYPIKLAWALTIHKGQGKTFARVAVDIGLGTFSPGQLYVALSRCVSLDGLILKKPISAKNIWLDWRVMKFITDFQYQKSEEAMPLERKMEIIKQAIGSGEKLAIVYLKKDDVKSRRVIIPQTMGQMEYLGKTYLGLEAYCLERKTQRVFRIDRILEMRVLQKVEILLDKAKNLNNAKILKIGDSAFDINC